jgi:hypothetical protein
MSDYNAAFDGLIRLQIPQPPPLDFDEKSKGFNEMIAARTAMYRETELLNIALSALVSTTKDSNEGAALAAFATDQVKAKGQPLTGYGTLLTNFKWNAKSATSGSLTGKTLVILDNNPNLPR